MSAEWPSSWGFREDEAVDSRMLIPDGDGIDGDILGSGALRSRPGGLTACESVYLGGFGIFSLITFVS